MFMKYAIYIIICVGLLTITEKALNYVARIIGYLYDCELGLTSLFLPLILVVLAVLTIAFVFVSVLKYAFIMVIL